MRFADISLAVFTLYGLSAGVCWLSAQRIAARNGETGRAARRQKSLFVCPLTGRRCEGDLAAGAPEAMGCCHCRSCRSWSGGPVNAFTLWRPSAVKVTAGADHLATFQQAPMSQRQYCSKCGGHLMNNHPTLGLTDVFAATLPTLKFEPGVHVNYAETVLRMRDGLPKLKDFPEAFGGSGETVPE